MFNVAILPRSPGVVYYHLLLRRETRIPGVAPFSFRIGIWDPFLKTLSPSVSVSSDIGGGGGGGGWGVISGELRPSVI